MVTVVTKTIGSGGGRDYSTISAWEADTDNDLVAADQQQVGELYDDSDFSLGSDQQFGGSTVDATRNRILRAAAGQHYNPVLDVGVWVTNGGNNRALDVRESYFTLSGIGFENTYNNIISTFCFNIIVGITGALIERCYGELALATGTAPVFSAGSGTIRNCIAVGSNGGSGGASTGFSLVGSTGASAFNCVAWGIAKVAGLEDGFNATAATTYKVKNCVAVLSGRDDFHAIANGSGNEVEYNVSEDSTASGTGSSTGVSSAVAFQSAGQSPANFYPAEASPLVDGGLQLSSFFTDDLAGATRTTPWDVGAYDVIGPPRAHDRFFAVCT